MAGAPSLNEGRLVITNVVAIGLVAVAPVDLGAVRAASPGLCFAGRPTVGRLSFYTPSPRAAVTLYRSGKVLITGARDLADPPGALEVAIETLRAAGIAIRPSPAVEVVNIVAKYAIGREVNLLRLTEATGTEKIEYEPEIFPGLVYRPEGLRATALIFRTGAAILTGARDLEDLGHISTAVDRLVAIDGG